MLLNITPVEKIITGNVYMVEMADGAVDSFRVLTETPTHYILSYSIDGAVEVFEKTKSEIKAIYDVKEWLAGNKI
jgi:hypothetical protein